MEYLTITPTEQKFQEIAKVERQHLRAINKDNPIPKEIELLEQKHEALRQGLPTAEEQIRAEVLAAKEEEILREAITQQVETEIDKASPEGETTPPEVALQVISTLKPD